MVSERNNLLTRLAVSVVRSSSLLFLSEDEENFTVDAKLELMKPSLLGSKDLSCLPKSGNKVLVNCTSESSDPLCKTVVQWETRNITFYLTTKLNILDKSINQSSKNNLYNLFKLVTKQPFLRVFNIKACDYTRWYSTC